MAQNIYNGYTNNQEFNPLTVQNDGITIDDNVRTLNFEDGLIGTQGEAGTIDTSVDISELPIDTFTVSKLYQPDGTNAFVYTDNSGSLHIDGDITQSGSTYETHAEQLYTTKDLIITRDGAVTAIPAGEISGIQVEKYDGASDLLFGTDVDGYFKVGESGSLQILATREDTPQSGGVAYFNDTLKRLDTSASLFWDSVNSRLGIGTTSPKHILQTYGVLKVGGSASQNVGIIALGDDLTDNKNVGIFRSNTTGLITGGNSLTLASYDDMVFTSSSNNMGLQTVRMLIDSSTGNVGIGTTSPNEQLEITKNFRLADQQTDTDSLNGIIYKGTNTFIHNFRHATGNTARPDGNNLFIGENAGNLTMGSTATSTTHASYNTGIGKLSLNNNTTGSNNSAVGMFSLRYNTTGSNNSAVGLNSLLSNTSGAYNSALGLNSGRYITDGTTANETSNTSVYLGADTKALADGDSNEIVIGYNAIGLGSNTAVIGNSSITTTALRGNVGIGTTTPSYSLHTTGDIRLNERILFSGTNTYPRIRRVGSDLYFDTNTLASALLIKDGGNVGIGTSSPANKLHISTATGNEYIRTTTVGANSISGLIIQNDAREWVIRNIGSDGDKFQIRDATANAERLTIDSSGNVGIGTTAPDYKLQIDGDLNIANNEWISALDYAGTGTVNMFKVNASNEIDVGGTLNIGTLNLAEDSGAVTLVNMPVSSTPTAGDEMSYSFSVDSTVVAKIYAEADGSGGIQNPKFDITGNLKASGSLTLPYVAKTATYTVTDTDYTIDCTANTFTVTLPTAVGITGRIYNIKNTGAGTITVDGDGSETIDGQTTQTVAQWENLQIQSNGANWIIL